MGMERGTFLGGEKRRKGLGHRPSLKPFPNPFLLHPYAIVLT